jgi:hypothetical protein
MCSVQNGFRDRAISLYSNVHTSSHTAPLFEALCEATAGHCDVKQVTLRRATRYILTRVAEWIDVDGGILGNVLYYTVITDMETSKRSTQQAFSCCDSILETGPAAPQ